MVTAVGRDETFDRNSLTDLPNVADERRDGVGVGGVGLDDEPAVADAQIPRDTAVG